MRLLLAIRDQRIYSRAGEIIAIELYDRTSSLQVLLILSRMISCCARYTSLNVVGLGLKFVEEANALADPCAFHSATATTSR